MEIENGIYNFKYFSKNMSHLEKLKKSVSQFDPSTGKIENLLNKI